MKTLVKNFLVGILLLALLSSVAGCGDEAVITSGTSDVISSAVEDDFFGETIESETASVVSESNVSAGSTSSTVNQTTTQSGSSLSLKDVLKQIPKNAKGKTIVVYNWNTESEYTGASKVIEEFTQKTGIKIQWKTSNFDLYLDNLANLVASGQSPDLVRLRNPEPAGLKNIQPISVSGFDFSDSAWDKQLMKDYTYGNKTYGVNLENTNIASPEILAYNKSLIKKYELDDPYKLWKNGKWTVDKFIKICQDFKKAAKAESAYTMFDLGDYTSMYGFKAPITSKNGKFESIVNNTTFRKQVVEACDYINTSKLFDCGWKSSEFDRGEILFFSASAIHMRRTNAYFSSLKSSGNLGGVPVPTAGGTTSKAYFAEMEAYGIAKGAKNAQLAPYFLRYFLDSENYDMKSFFASEQIKEVYTYLMNLNETAWTVGWSGHAFYGGNPDKFRSDISEVNGSQAATVIAKYSTIIANRAKAYNEAANGLK